MRVALLVGLLALAPFSVLPTGSASVDASSATFEASSACMLGGQRVFGLGANLAGCAVSQAGEIAFRGCDGVACTFTVTIAAAISGAPPGMHSISATADESAAAGGRGVVCAEEVVSLEDGVSCSGTRDVVILIPSQCRFVSIESRGMADASGAGAAVRNEFRVCLVAGGATFEPM